MPTERDGDFGMLLEAPHAYHAQQKGFAQALSAGVPPERAAAMCGLTQEEMAGAWGVFRRARGLARSAGRLSKRAAGVATQLHPLALAAHGAQFAGRGLAAATAPLRRRIFRAFFHKLIERRARFLSWRRRRTLVPAHADSADARAWAIRYVRRRGLLGKLVGAALSGEVVGEAATTVLVTASIPVLIQLARRALRAAEGQGAPSDPRTSEAPAAAVQAPSEE
jgi:hypothetical protein